MRRLISILTVVLIVSLCGCEKYIIEKPGVPQDVSFSADIQPIFDANCVTCHSGGRNPDLRPSHSYNSLVNGGFVNTDNPESSEIYQVLRGSHESRASEQEKLLILGWITEGAKNN